MSLRVLSHTAPTGVTSSSWRRLGVAPVVVSDGQAAVDAALNDTFDVVLMDVHMAV